MKRSLFIIFCLEGAILSFNVAACSALIPSISQEFSVSQFIAGRAVWLYMLPYGIAALLYGPLVRRFDARRIELTCFLFFSLANLFAALSPDINRFFTARLLMGIFGASVIPLVLILIARHGAAKTRGRQIGVFFSATFVASLAGLFLSGLINWRMIFLIPGLAGIALWVYMYFNLPSFQKDCGGFKINYLAAFKSRAVVSIFTYIFLISLLYHGVQQWLGVFFSVKFGLSQFLVSMLVTLTSLSGIFGEVIGGWLADTLGRIRTIDLGIMIMIVSLILLLFKIPLVMIAVAMIAWGLGWTFNHAGLSTLLTDLPSEFLNEAASLNSSVRFVSGGVGAAAGGMIMQKSFSTGFIIAAVALTALAVSAKKLLNQGG
ncbi:MAG: MFS transporter [Candidatus Omnitrophota bacterium]